VDGGSHGLPGPVELLKENGHFGHPLSKDPYFLYAASNFGGMVGLLSYPILIEPRFRLAEQGRLWEYGYAILVLLIGVCAGTLWRAPRAQNPGELRPDAEERASAPALRVRLCWLDRTWRARCCARAARGRAVRACMPVPINRERGRLGVIKSASHCARAIATTTVAGNPRESFPS